MPENNLVEFRPDSNATLAAAVRRLASRRRLTISRRPTPRGLVYLVPADLLEEARKNLTAPPKTTGGWKQQRFTPS